MSAANADVDVLVIGTGPVGLALANLLGIRGVSVAVMEKRDQLIDYPRGVGLDDESMRTIQAMGLAEEFLPYTIPHHIMRLVDGAGNVILTNNPQGEPYGWPRKFGFLQPLADKASFDGLSRFPHVTTTFGRELVKIEEVAGGVRATFDVVRGEEGEERTGEQETVTAKYLVGCEGGRSFTRKWMGTEFEGKSPSTRWVVVDVNNDPLGAPNVYLGADPNRPYVSIGLPRGVRRWEFMLFDDEPTEKVEDNAFIEELLAEHIPEGTKLDVIRRRVFTHHGRMARTFRKGNVLIAGDAAHLMPVWMGQGYNSGIRDVTNLAWKLAGVLQGKFSPALLDTYDVERRDHAKAMIDLSMTFGTVIKPTDKKVAFVRDTAAKLMNLSPRVKDYFADMKFKPVPRYGRGAVVDQATLKPGVADRSNDPARRPRIVTSRVAVNRLSPVGLQLIQPKVEYEGEAVLLDEALGLNHAVLSWGVDPARLFTPKQLAELAQAEVKLVCVVSPTQVEWAKQHVSEGTEVVSDITGALKGFFDTRAVGTVLVRPDRFVAAATLNAQAGQAWESYKRAAHVRAYQADTDN